MYTLKEKTIFQAFSSPIEWYAIEESEDLNKALLPEIAAYQKQSEGIQKSNRLGWHSPDDLFKRQESGFKQLCDIIKSCVARTTSRHFSDFVPETTNTDYSGWINVNLQNAYNAPHIHPGSLWSGTYYVSVPKANSDDRGSPDSGAIEFLDPRATQMSMPAEMGSNFLQRRMRFVPEPGSLVVFPSYLVHWVYPNEQDEKRVSIAFNMSIPKQMRQD